MIIKAKKGCTYRKCQASSIHIDDRNLRLTIINKFHQGIKKIMDNDKFKLIIEM